jgi:signal transduction histidine kinase
MRILLIEDNPDHALVARRVLKQAGQEYEVECALEAHEARAKIAAGQFDLILCDYRLPDASALDILKELRAKGCDVPFIVSTSAGSEKIAVELMQEGAYDYIVKDGSYETTLPLVIRRAVEKYSVKKETERLQLELGESNKKLQEMYEIKSNFTSMVSHELRTPLTAIKEGIALVLEGASGDVNAKQKEFLQLAQRNVDRLKRLIDDVLDFSKLESKRMKFIFKDGSLNDVISDVCQAQRIVAEEKGLYLKTELDPVVPRIAFDQDRLSQVLANLISNAIKFTQQGGLCICSFMKVDQGYVEVSVRDTGMGIKQEDIPKLFQKFQQLDSSHRQTGGTGLGLALSKEIVDAHGGMIRVESVYGSGSAFVFTVPTRRRWKVLIIDDDTIVLEVCEKLLRNDIVLTLCAQTGKEGLRMALEEAPDLIILDMRLTDTNGYEVINHLKGSDKTKHIPVLMMSGFVEELDKMRKQPQGAALLWISKPFEREELVPKIHDMLGISSG